MVTKAELLQDSKNQESQEKADKEQRAKEDDKWIKDYTSRMHEKVLGLMDGELGEFLKWANKQKLSLVRIEDHRCWKPSGYDDGWSELYDAEFELGFAPDPNFSPTKLLVKKLKQAGLE